MSRRIQESHTVSMGVVCGVLLVVGAILWLLLPNQGEMLTRMLEDGRLEDARKVYDEMQVWDRWRGEDVMAYAEVVFRRCDYEEMNEPGAGGGGKLSSEQVGELMEFVLEGMAEYRGDERFLNEGVEVLARLTGMGGERGWQEVQMQVMAMLSTRDGAQKVKVRVNEQGEVGEDVLFQRIYKRANEVGNGYVLALFGRRKLDEGYEGGGVRQNDVVRVMKYWEGAGMVNEGVRDGELYLGYAQSKNEESGMVVEELVKLLRQSNQPVRAFRMMKRFSDELRVMQEEREWLMNYSEVALQAGSGAEVVNEMWDWVLKEQGEDGDEDEKVVNERGEAKGEAKGGVNLERENGLSEDYEFWARLGGVALEGKRFDVAVEAFRVLRRQKRISEDADERQRVSMLLAQAYEWGDRPDEAFDLYMELALNGLRKGVVNEQVVERMEALNEGLFRDRDFLGVLEKVLEVNMEVGLMMRVADLNRKLGRYDEARKWYEQVISGYEGDKKRSKAVRSMAGEAWRQIGFIRKEEDEWEGALEAFEKVLELQGEDGGDEVKGVNAVVRAEMAELWYLQGQYEKALVILRRLAEETKQYKVVQKYLLVAEALGAREDVVRGLELYTGLEGVAVAGDFASLAYQYRLMGREDGWLDMMGKVAAMDDANVELRKQFIYGLISVRRYEAALVEVMKLERDGVPVEDYREVAGMYAGLERVKRASDFMERYCRDYEGASGLAWRELGDYRLQAGNVKGAERAYREALSRFYVDEEGGGGE